MTPLLFSLVRRASLAACLLMPLHSRGQQSDPWRADQLVAPADLASAMRSGSPLPLIIDVGPAGRISHSVAEGPAGQSAGYDSLKQWLSGLPRDTGILIYCGCCPFSFCPNIRPAFALLKEMGFSDIRLLNLADNLKADWIDKGYPLAGPGGGTAK